MQELIGYDYAETATDRSTFIKKTYIHLLGAIIGFVVLESYFLKSETIINMWSEILSYNYGWLSIIGLVMAGSWLATNFAFKPEKNMQYLGLGLYVVLEALIFTPLLLILLAQSNGTELLMQAVGMTAALFTGLTLVVVTSNKDFSFLRSAIMVGGVLAIGLMITGIIFGFDLGLWFSVFMVVLAAGSILYQTSKVFKTYPTQFYVGAALGLFASFMLLLWYIIRIFMGRD
jgi:FtsH-binding integral membrane protein